MKKYNNFDLHFTGKVFCYNALEEIDLLYADRMGEKLKKEIEEKGIVVFDREGLYV